MRESGQRQDVAFLALAVAVLAVAVALFVGMKLMPKKAAPPPVEEETEKAAPAEPVQETKEEASDRDPFRAQVSEGAPSHVEPKAQLKLVGIVTGAGTQPTAVIHAGTRHYFAKVGGRAGGYTVESIGSNSAVLVRNGGRVTLSLRRPQPEE